MEGLKVVIAYRHRRSGFNRYICSYQVGFCCACPALLSSTPRAARAPVGRSACMYVYREWGINT
jgi:hypothetical protein